jgi:murein DD-endopeptidase MepM/ murein hydrolase activator NlpD
MKKCAHNLLFLFLFLLPVKWSDAQELPPDGGGAFDLPLNTQPCLTPEERQEIVRVLEENRDRLRKEGLLPEQVSQPRAAVAFDWPLRKSSSLNWNSYYGISNFVDQDVSAGVLLDYDCEMRTYDGHNGTDFFTWPFPWYLYDNDYIEVIAGEGGNILFKSDGNDDDHCSCFGNWNAVYVEHADGSIAWYGHLKDGSLTGKSVGDAVNKGEYLGIVASSGCSTGPHLHFEVYEQLPYNHGNLVDPYSGACNNTNGSSWWATQPPYREPTLNAVLTHYGPPVMGCPGSDEDPKFSNNFEVGEQVYTAFYYHDQTTGDISNMRIRKPDNSIWQSWNYTSPNTYNASYSYWIWNLPSGGPFGTWKVEVDYQSNTYTHEFNYSIALPVEWVGFKAELTERHTTNLFWETSAALNHHRFEVQHSNNYLSWQSVGTVIGPENSLTREKYVFVHENPTPGVNYYRIKSVDLDGTYEYSTVVSVFLDQTQDDQQIVPNPTKGLIWLKDVDPQEVLSKQVFDQTGRLILQNTFQDNQVDLSVLPNGLYYLQLQTVTTLQTYKVLKH